MGTNKKYQTEKTAGDSGFFIALVLRLEHILAETAGRTSPIVREIFKCRAGRDAVIRIADFGIVYISAGANILHCDILLMI